MQTRKSIYLTNQHRRAKVTDSFVGKHHLATDQHANRPPVIILGRRGALAVVLTTAIGTELGPTESNGRQRQATCIIVSCLRPTGLGDRAHFRDQNEWLRQSLLMWAPFLSYIQSQLEKRPLSGTCLQRIEHDLKAHHDGVRRPIRAYKTSKTVDMVLPLPSPHTHYPCYTDQHVFEGTRFCGLYNF